MDYSSTKGTGLLTWDSAVVLAKFIEFSLASNDHDAQATELNQMKLLSNCRIIELGAGTGKSLMLWTKRIINFLFSVLHAALFRIGESGLLGAWSKFCHCNRSAVLAGEPRKERAAKP